MSIKKYATLINQAESLRLKNHSLSEISNMLGISKSTASLWLKHLPNQYQVSNLDKATFKLSEIKQNYIQNVKEGALRDITEITNNSTSVKISKLICACLFWAEGSKTTNCLHFTNSDPLMISSFLTNLRKAYELDESKFRVKMHLHEYHNEQKLQAFWGNTTKIPKTQFTKSYLKPHTSKRIKKNYKGCIRLTYYDYRIALDLKETYNAIAKAI